MSTPPDRLLALVVEDDPDQAAIFASALQLAHYQTEVLMEGGSVLSRLAEITPDLVVLDLHLPGVSGEQLLHHIRSVDRLASTVVFLATADGALAQLLSDDATLILLKPVSFAQLKTLGDRFRFRTHRPRSRDLN